MKLTPKFKIGDLVRCIQIKDNALRKLFGIPTPPVQIGGLYIISGIDYEDGDVHVTYSVNDTKCLSYEGRFELAPISIPIEITLKA